MQPSIVKIGANYELQLQTTAAPHEERKLALSRLKAAFPQTTEGVLLSVAECIERNRITSEQLKRSVNRLIDTFRYPSFTTADLFANVTTKVPLMTHWQAYTYGGNKIPNDLTRKVALVPHVGLLYAKVTDLIAAGYDV